MNTEQASAQALNIPYMENLCVAIVQARWNSHITDALTAGAVEYLKSQGYADENIEVHKVTGTIELTFAAARLMETGDYDAIIEIGCVIKGDTPHFDFVCQSVTDGCTQLNAKAQIPVLFGVITTLNEQQALDRAGGSAGNKGAEAAAAALEMIDFARKIK